MVLLLLSQGLNQIKEVTTNELEMLNGLRYLSFGWWGNYFITCRLIQPTEQLVEKSLRTVPVKKQKHQNIIPSKLSLKLKDIFRYRNF